jgi:hypothetical protein
MIYIIPLNLTATIKIIKNIYVHKRKQFLWMDVLQKVTHIFYVFYLLFYFKFLLKNFHFQCLYVDSLKI